MKDGLKEGPFFCRNARKERQGVFPCQQFNGSHQGCTAMNAINWALVTINHELLITVCVCLEAPYAKVTKLRIV